MPRLLERTLRIERLFADEPEKAKQSWKRIFNAIPKVDWLIIMAGLEAEFRGEPYPEGFDQVMDRFEKLDGGEALRRLELFDTDTDRARAAELRRRMTAGESWREINL